VTHLPSLTALRCLDASARLASFTKAAQELHLTQSAVSHHILNLERQLDVKLFERDGGGVQLTAAGRTYWKETLPALEQLWRATERATAKRDKASLTVSAPPSFTSAWLMRRVCEFVANNPDITLNLVNRGAAPREDYGEEDAAVELSEGSAPGIETVRLLSLVYSPYASRGLLHRFEWYEATNDGAASPNALVQILRSSPLIRTSMADAWPGWLQLAKLNEAISPAHAADGPLYSQASLALIAVLSDAGVALLPKHVAAEHHRAGSLVQLSSIGWPARRAYHLQWPVSRAVSPPLRRFADWAATIAESEAT